MKFLKKRATVSSIIAVSLLLLIVGIFMSTFLTESFDASTAIAAPTDPADIVRAQATTATLASALLSAVGTITANVTPDSVEADSEAVSILLPKCQKVYRLLDASGDPIDLDNLPNGNFEFSALADALDGITTQEVVGGHLRTVVPLTNSDPNCATCHMNYNDFPAGTVIGAASFKVKL